MIHFIKTAGDLLNFELFLRIEEGDSSRGSSYYIIDVIRFSKR
jgi:hypothetical protein